MKFFDFKFFEKKLNERFKDASSLEGIDADDLWSQIESEVSEKPPNKFSFYFWKKRLFLLIPLFFLIGGLVWYQLLDKSSLEITEAITPKTQIQNTIEKEENNIESNDLENANVEKKSSIKINDENSVKTNNKTNSNNNKFTENKNDENSIVANGIQSNDGNLNSNELKGISKNIISSNEITNQEESEKQIKLESNNNKIDNASKESSLVNEAVTPKDIDNQTKSASDNKIDNTSKEPSLIKDIVAPSQIQNVEELGSLPITLLKEEQEITSLGHLYIPFSKSRLRLGVFAGLHTVKNNFSTDQSANEERKNLLNDGFEYELGQTYSVELSFRLHKNIENLYLKSGIEYLKSVSEFNLIQTWDTTMVNPNSPVGSITDAKAVRTIVHHNEMKFLSIPLMIAFQKSLGKMEIGASAGVGLNFTRSQTGRALNFNNDITLYPNNDNSDLPTSNFFLSYQFRPYLNYGISRKTFIQLRANFRYQNYGDSDFYGLKHSSILMGVGLGIEHKF